MTVRLILGDCLKVMDLLKHEDAVIDHAIFDPPYEDNMHRAKEAHVHRRRGHRIDGGRELASLDFASITAIRQPTTEKIKTLCRGWFVAFCTPEGVAAWRDEIEAAGARYKRACVWVKPDAAPQFNGQGPAMGAEMIVTAWMGKGISQWNGGGKRGVFEHPCNPSDRQKQPDGTALHPTEKPLSLMMELVSLFTNPGDTVLDPFMGIGSTGVACVKLGRNFIGIEKNPGYFREAARRIDQTMAQPDMFLPKKSDKPDVLMLTNGGKLCTPKSNSPSARSARSKNAATITRSGSARAK